MKKTGVTNSATPSKLAAPVDVIGRVLNTCAAVQNEVCIMALNNRFDEAIDQLNKTIEVITRVMDKAAKDPRGPQLLVHKRNFEGWSGILLTRPKDFKETVVQLRKAPCNPPMTTPEPPLPPLPSTPAPPPPPAKSTVPTKSAKTPSIWRASAAAPDSPKAPSAPATDAPPLPPLPSSLAQSTPQLISATTSSQHTHTSTSRTASRQMSPLPPTPAAALARSISAPVVCATPVQPPAVVMVQATEAHAAGERDGYTFIQTVMDCFKSDARDTGASDLQLMLRNAMMAVKSAEGLRVENNVKGSVQQYRSAVERLLQVISTLEPDDLTKRRMKQARDLGMLVGSKTLSGEAALRGLESSDPGITRRQLRMTPIIYVDLVRDNVKIQERIGGGSSGATIYRCTCQGLTFAAKILVTATVPEIINAVFTEIELLTTLNHPNVIKYLGHDFTKKDEMRLYMEYYPKTLMRIIKERHDIGTIAMYFSLAQIQTWALQIASGLQYLHSRTPPIVHRDLKSENIFVTLDYMGRIDTVKIGDFDTAKIMQTTETSFTRNIGTEGYMAPEMCHPSAKGYTDKVDIWSFGMVLCEMMQLDQPYCQEKAETRRNMQFNGTRPKLKLPDAKATEYQPLINIYRSCSENRAGNRPSAQQLVALFTQHS